MATPRVSRRCTNRASLPLRQRHTTMDSIDCVRGAHGYAPLASIESIENAVSKLTDEDCAPLWRGSVRSCGGDWTTGAARGGSPRNGAHRKRATQQAAKGNHRGAREGGVRTHFPLRRSDWRRGLPDTDDATVIADPIYPEDEVLLAAETLALDGDADSFVSKLSGNPYLTAAMDSDTVSGRRDVLPSFQPRVACGRCGGCWGGERGCICPFRLSPRRVVWPQINDPPISQ